jgi:hypothetical protein
MAKASKTPTYISHESTVDGAVSDAFGELTTLGEEMRESFDNTPENFQTSGVGEARGEAADALENLSEPSVPSELADYAVSWSTRALSPSQMRKQSRASRRDDAVATLQAVVDRLEEIRSYQQPDNDDLAEGEAPEESEYSEACLSG